MDDSLNIDGGFRRRVWIGLLAVAGTIAVIALLNPFIDHGRTVQTTEMTGTVMSVTSGRSTKYLVRLPDGRTMSLNGPKLPMYPVSSDIPLKLDRFTDGTMRYEIVP